MDNLNNNSQQVHPEMLFMEKMAMNASKAFEYYGGKSPLTLYHYTTLEAFMSIFSRDHPTSFASHIGYMNDRTEHKHGTSIILDEINALVGSPKTEQYQTILRYLRDSLSLDTPVHSH